MLVSIVARLLSAFVSVYMILCTLRILLSWLPSLDLGRGGELLRAATDPYLDFFARFPFLRAGQFDFSPIAALSILAVANNLFSTLAFAGRISVGLALGMVLSALWSAVSFVLSFLAVCALIRIIAYAAHWNSLHPLWMVIDAMLNPVLYRVNRLVYRSRIVNYLQGLMTGFAALILVRVAGGAFVGLLVRLVGGLPF